MKLRYLFFTLMLTVFGLLVLEQNVLSAEIPIGPAHAAQLENYGMPPVLAMDDPTDEIVLRAGLLMNATDPTDDIGGPLPDKTVLAKGGWLASPPHLSTPDKPTDMYSYKQEIGSGPIGSVIKGPMVSQIHIRQLLIIDGEYPDRIIPSSVQVNAYELPG